jgi:hypothetical protein
VSAAGCFGGGWRRGQFGLAELEAAPVGEAENVLHESPWVNRVLILACLEVGERNLGFGFSKWLVGVTGLKLKTSAKRPKAV